MPHIRPSPHKQRLVDFTHNCATLIANTSKQSAILRQKIGRGDRAVKTLTFRWAHPIAAVAACAVLASCGLPQVGPNKRQIYAGSVQREGDAFVVAVNDRVTRATAVVPALGFSDAFKNAGTLGSDTIRAGDVLGITVYENVDDSLLGTEGAPATAGRSSGRRCWLHLYSLCGSDQSSGQLPRSDPPHHHQQIGRSDT